MGKWSVGVICVLLAFAAVAVAEEKADEGMVSSGNILLLINGSPNFAAGYGSLKVEPDEGDSQEGNVLMFSAGGRLGFFIQKSFAFGAFGSLAYAKAESEVAVPGVEGSFEDPVTLTAITLGPWVGYFVDLNSWFIPYVGVEAGLNYTKIEDKNTDSTTTMMLLGADLIAGALFNFAGNWALNIEMDMSPADLRTLLNSFAVGLAVSF